MFDGGQRTERPRGRTWVVASVMETGRAAIDAAIGEAARAGADAIEIRFDAAPRTDPAEIGTGSSVSLIATCRPRDLGGRFEGSESERIRILERAAGTGRFFLDVEHATDAAALMRRFPRRVAVLSHHDPTSTEAASLPALARAMLAEAPDDVVVKIVTRARRADDVLAIRALLAAMRAPRLAAFAMGEEGWTSRILAGAWGSAAIWAGARSVQAPAAPGQIGLETLLGLYRFHGLGPSTTLFGVAGSPVGGSLSPRIHNAVLSRLGLDAVYLPIACDDPQALDRLCRELRLQGVSVTAPLKVAVMERADRIDDSARRAGACNTLLLRPDSSGDTSRPLLHAFNTDGAAALAEIRRAVDPAGRRALIAGAGGAARAVAHALVEAGATVTLAARNEERGRAVADELGTRFVPLGAAGADPEAIVVQATSAPLSDPVLSDASLRCATLLDLRYGRDGSESATVTRARSLGSGAAGGLGMLARQAAAQAALFLGRSVPEAWFFEALEGSTPGVGTRGRGGDAAESSLS